MRRIFRSSVRYDREDKVTLPYHSCALTYFYSQAMPAMKVVVSILVLLAVLFQPVSSGATLSIKLLHFENQKGLLPDGSCCDGFTPGTITCAGCEYYFIFCISDLSYHPCSISKIWTDVLGYRNYYAFGATFLTVPDYKEVTNPVVFRLAKWNGFLLLNVGVYDDDYGNNEFSHTQNDRVSTLIQNVSIEASRRTMNRKKTVLLAGRQRRPGIFPKLSMEISIICDDNFLIPSCSDFCIDKDDDTGHYRCNYTAGVRDCLEGWHGIMCQNKIKKCSARNDSLGHYSCNTTSGEKVCLLGWTNDTANCTQAIKVAPSIATSSSKISTQNSKQVTAIITHTTLKQHTPSTMEIRPSVIGGTVLKEHSTKVVTAPISLSTPTSIPVLVKETYRVVLHGNSSKVITTPISLSTSTSIPVLVKETYRVILHGNNSKINSRSLAEVEKEICKELRTSYFKTNVTCIYSSSVNSTTSSNGQYIAFNQLKTNTSNGRTILEVTIIEKKSNKPSRPIKDVIMAARRTIKQHTSLNIVDVTKETPTGTQTYTQQMPRFSVMPSATQRPKSKTTFNVKRLGIFGLGILFLVILTIIILLVKTQKKKERRVHPFIEDEKGMKSKIISSRNSGKSNLSMQEYPTAKIIGSSRDENPLALPSSRSTNIFRVSSHTTQSNRIVETKFDTTELGMLDTQYQNHFIPPRTKHTNRKTSAL